MASWNEQANNEWSRQDAMAELLREIGAYLAAIATIREELDHDPAPVNEWSERA